MELQTLVGIYLVPYYLPIPYPIILNFLENQIYFHGKLAIELLAISPRGVEGQSFYTESTHYQIHSKSYLSSIPIKLHSAERHTQKSEFTNPRKQKNMRKMELREAEIIRDKDEMRRWSRRMRSQGKTIGLVPTMGYLHQGHISLIKEAHKHTDLIVVSIYVNPGQFAPSEDLSTYPSDFHGDLQKLVAVPGGVDAVFHPHNLYDYGSVGGGGRSGDCDVSEEGKGVISCLEERGFGHETWVRVERLEKSMCGKSRPVFFRGVATIVSKLFNIVEPDVAVFGKKDYQQWRIISRMVSVLKKF